MIYLLLLVLPKCPRRLEVQALLVAFVVVGAATGQLMDQLTATTAASDATTTPDDDAATAAAATTAGFKLCLGGNRRPRNDQKIIISGNDCC